MHDPVALARTGPVKKATLLVNLIAFAACGALAYGRNLHGLFHSFDGLYMLVEVLN